MWRENTPKNEELRRMPDQVIRIGTRKSKLAMWQAYYVEKRIQQEGWQTELVTMETKGDKVLNVSIAKIGSKGVFTEELEEKLQDGSIDIAVHSAKDMQSSLPESFEIIAFSERERAEDVIISDNPLALDQPLLIGTSSTRRIATLNHFYPHIKTVEMRGNLQTRIQKMRDGHCEALLLAYAGVHRMQYDDLIQQILPLHQFVPAVGQGSVAIESHVDLAADKKSAIVKALNHHKTAQCLKAERAFLKQLEGGCSIPVFALAMEKNGVISIEGGIVSLDGSQRIFKSVSNPLPEEAGLQLAHEVLNAGGESILKEIKSQM